MAAVKVTAHLAGGLAGDPPKLDALLEAVMAPHCGKAASGRKLDRGSPAPEQGEIPIPLQRRRLGPWLVGLCSDPIPGPVLADGHDHVAKRINPDGASLLDPAERRKIATSNTWTKSYRLPLRVRLVDRVVWFADADPKNLRRTLKRCRAIGKKTAIGHGRVTEWTVEPIAVDLSWFAATDDGPLLMRTLPVGPWLPDGLTGFRPDFGAAAPPYWHPSRFTEIVVPC